MKASKSKPQSKTFRFNSKEHSLLVSALDVMLEGIDESNVPDIDIEDTKRDVASLRKLRTKLLS